MEKPFIGAYWSARQETRRECAERIFKFLRSISDDPLFARWCLKGRNRKTANNPLELSVEAIEHKLESSYTDIPKKPMPELGFMLSVWNGNDAASVGLMVTCGAFSRVVGNAVVLKLPRQEPPINAISFDRFHTLVKKAVEAFDPDVAVATSSELNAMGSGNVQENEAWIKYRRGQGVIFRQPQGQSGMALS